MRLPRLFAAGFWLAATVASTAMVWTATSIVLADVTDRPAPVVAHQDVVSELESGSSVIGAAPTSTTRKGSSPTPVAPSGRGPVPPVPVTPSPSTSRSPPAGAAGAPVPATTTTTRAAAAPTQRPATTTTTQAPRPTAAYSTTGGVVRVACNGFFIELLSAIPSNGYSVRVLSPDPATSTCALSAQARSCRSRPHASANRSATTSRTPRGRARDPREALTSRFSDEGLAAALPRLRHRAVTLHPVATQRRRTGGTC